MYIKNSKILLKVFFNEFKYISFITSLIIVVLVTSNSKRINVINFDVDFISSNFKIEKYVGNNLTSQNINGSTKFIFVDLKNLIEVEKVENITELFGDRTNIFLNINNALNLNKLNFELKSNNITFDLDKKKITLLFIQSHSFFTYRQISNYEILKLQEIIEVELNNIVKKKNLSIKSFTKLNNLHQSKNDHLKAIGSIIFLTFFFNFLYSLIKYRKNFF